MHTPRIGFVRYLNTVPLVEGLEAWSGVGLLPGAPAELADMLREGRADVALVSLVDALGPRGSLTLLPEGMIGCDGPTLTVRVFSRSPLDRVSQLAVDRESHTSVALARLVLEYRHGTRPEIGVFTAPDAGAWEGAPESVLLIGDKVVNAAPPERLYPHQLDLGAAWHELTGLPFVYAVWMCRAGEESSATVRTAREVLERQRRRNRMRLDWLIAKHAPGHGWPVELASRYVKEYLRYEVGPREREAVGRFAVLARELGVLPPGEPPRWADAGAAAVGEAVRRAAAPTSTLQP
ncbi:MAG: menaquinone biosynthesis protein [Phycisphaerae bacterium]|nr:menaquinone biosynthesis protein [Phycisphaerae bacterium]